KAITHPVPGNHEYATTGTDCDSTGGAAGYFRYFGAAAGDATKAYYSYDIGSWHLIALNSNCSSIGGCGAGSPEETWLRTDLAAHANTCTIAYWHHPRFTSGESHVNDTEVANFWQDLYNAGADIVLNGHVHGYERFAPQDPNQNYDPAHGIRELVVGTGGEDFHGFTTPQPLSEVRQANTFGVLMLPLQSTPTWHGRFAPVSTEAVRRVGAAILSSDRLSDRPSISRRYGARPLHGRWTKTSTSCRGRAPSESWRPPDHGWCRWCSWSASSAMDSSCRSSSPVTTCRRRKPLASRR